MVSPPLRRYDEADGADALSMGITMIIFAVLRVEIDRSPPRPYGEHKG